jgi:hypothetical protein
LSQAADKNRQMEKPKYGYSGVTPMPNEDDLFKNIEGHLTYFGYRMKSEDGVLKTLEGPPGFTVFWIWPINQGATFRSLFTVGPNAKTDPTGFCNFLNQANNLAVVSRFLTRENEFLSVEAWFPPSYTREGFAIFFSRYLADIIAPALTDRATVLRFFPNEEAATQNSLKTRESK